MKNKVIMIFIALLFTLVTQCNRPAGTPSSDTPQTDPAQSLAERGEYLVTIIGCDHCHAPKMMTAEGPVPDRDRWLMGYPSQDPLPAMVKNESAPGQWTLFNNDLTAAVGPWGVSFSANLTPHPTGLGTWTFEQFKKAMTQGRYKGIENTRMLLPPMPWQSYSHMKDEDLEAIFEYLKTIKPIENLVPDHIPPQSP